MKKRALIITSCAIGVPLLAGVLIAAYYTLPWAIMFIGLHSLPNPPRPEITYGEFPFKLVYEINGKEVVVEDTIICEFDGFGINEGNGKYRKWKTYLASGEPSPAEYEVSVEIDKINEIYFYIGDSSYYMGEKGYNGYYDLNFHTYRIQRNFDGQGRPRVSDEELLSKYKIKLISFEPSPPIKNSFE